MDGCGCAHEALNTLTNRWMEKERDCKLCWTAVLQESSPRKDFPTADAVVAAERNIAEGPCCADEKQVDCADGELYT